MYSQKLSLVESNFFIYFRFQVLAFLSNNVHGSFKKSCFIARIKVLKRKSFVDSRYVKQKNTNSEGKFFNILKRGTNCADMFVDKCFMWTRIPSSEYKKAIVEDLYRMGLTFCFWKSSQYFEQAVRTVYKLPVCILKPRQFRFFWSTGAPVFCTFNQFSALHRGAFCQFPVDLLLLHLHFVS